jgi:hypothetical protein
MGLGGQLKVKRKGTAKRTWVYTTHEDKDLQLLKKKFAARLERVMLEQDISKHALAIRMRSTRSWVYRLLDPYDTRVSLGMVWRCSSALGVDLLAKR